MSTHSLSSLGLLSVFWYMYMYYASRWTVRAIEIPVINATRVRPNPLSTGATSTLDGLVTDVARLGIHDNLCVDSTDPFALAFHM